MDSKLISAYGNRNLDAWERRQHVSRDSNITDWSQPITKCLAGDYATLSSRNVVYNKNTLTGDMWVKLPPCAKQFSVAGIYQIQPQPQCPEDGRLTCSMRYRNIWLRIPIQFMDVSPGLKVYRIEFKHMHNLENMSLYISYTVQDDDPAKPYVYMKR